MAIPVLEFFSADWITIPAEISTVQFRIVAAPPVAAGVGIVVFARNTPPSPIQAGQWAQIARSVIDNLPSTAAGSMFELPMRPAAEYVLRFQGEAHLLMPGFQDITIAFELSRATDLITNFDGPRTANNTRVAAINGQTFLRHI